MRLDLVRHDPAVDGEGVGRAVAEDERLSRPVRRVDGRSVGRHGAHEDRRAPGAFQQHGLGIVHRLRDLAPEESLGAVAHQRFRVAPGNDLQAAVLLGGVVEVEEDGHRIPIGQGIVGQVLVPLHDGPDVLRLHVDLAVVEEQVRAEQLLDAVQQGDRLREIAERLIESARFVDAPHQRAVRFLVRFHLHARGVVIRLRVPFRYPVYF